jgi:hypothetical protein
MMMVTIMMMMMMMMVMKNSVHDYASLVVYRRR